jgi:curved DNA-binding protein
MEFKDYYQILGLERDVDQSHIKRAYRKLASKYHPDLNKADDAEARFKEVGEAYEVLKDPEKRAAYDELGADWQPGQQFKPPPDWEAGFEFAGGGGEGGFDPRGGGAHSDFFESLFGQAFRNASGHTSGYGSSNDFRSNRSNDHHAKVMIDLEDSLQGATKTISLRVPKLNSAGQLQNTERVLNIKIPKGVKAGQHIRLSGQAESGIADESPGDLYLEVEFKSHPFYRVEGSDLYYDLPLTPWEAALGAKINVPSPKGKVKLNIPEGSKNGRQLRLKGQGIPGKLAGDLYVVLQIALPAANTEKAKALYREMAESLDFNPRKHLNV